jgi:hypothetical protein
MVKAHDPGVVEHDETSMVVVVGENTRLYDPGSMFFELDESS